MVALLWQPKEKEFNEIYGLIEQQITRPEERIWTAQHLPFKFPDFNNYLAFILARAEGKSPVVRQGAGLLLKNILKSTFKSMNVANQGYIKSELLHCLQVANRQIKSSVGTTISVVVQLVGVSGWPELLHALVICLNSNDVNHIECAMDALLKICEDIPQALSSETPGLSEPPINFFLPRLFQLFQSPNALLREQSLRSVNRFIKLMPTVLRMSMDQYVQGLFCLANDPDPQVRILVCSAFAQLIKVLPAPFALYLRNVIQCILQLNKDPDDAVAMEACDFWCVYYEAQLPRENLQEFLPHLIPVLLTNLIYLEDDDESLANSEEDGSLPDRDQDMRPHFHGSEDAEDYDDDDVIGRWTLRKRSVDALEFMATMFEHEILPTFIPIVCAKLSSWDDANWKEREAAVLAFGTIADGCFKGLYPHLSETVTFIHHLLEDKFPMIRSISCWTLSRFSKFIVKEICHKEGQERFDKVLTGLLRRMLDTNKRVQASACSALLILTEMAAEELDPRLGIILQHIMHALEKYQRRNLRILYYVITTLVDVVGEELNKPEHLGALMPPLISKLQQLPHTNKDLCSLMRCFKFIAQALGDRFSQFALPVFQRCISIIQTQQLAKVHYASAGVDYDDELVVCSLDLLSGLASGLGSRVRSLVSQSNLRDLVLQCCVDDGVADVRLSAFSLLDHLARVCPTHLHPRMAEFFDVAAKQLDAARLNETNSVANRACEAIRELATKVNQEVGPSLMRLLSCLVSILQQTERINKSLRENSAITVGKLAWVFPELVSPHIHHFMQPWCIALSTLQDSAMKEDAFRGLCAVVRENPSGASNSLVFMFKCIASLHVIKSEDLRNEVSHILRSYKQILSEGAWEECMSALEAPVNDKLTRYLV